MAKEQPSLFDTLLATNANHIKGRDLPAMHKRIQRLQARIRSADKIVFNAEASARVGEVLREIPELLVEQIQFARAPFEVTWIEYDADMLIEAMGRPATAGRNDPTRDYRVGLLIDHNRINVFFQAFDNKLGLMPWQYHLHTEWPIADQLKFADTFCMSRMGIDMWLWGSTAAHFVNTGRTGYLRILRDTSMVEVLDGYYDNDPPAYRAEVLNGSNGDFKNIVALLLMLNQPKLTQYLHVPRRSGWIGNKHRPFMAYHNIHVALDATSQIKLVSDSNGIPVMRRGGKVRGHYCHDKTARDYARIAGCIHDWMATDDQWTPTPFMPLDEREHWQCKVCDGKRWWRDEHTRGGTGFVHHEQYTVTP